MYLHVRTKGYNRRRQTDKYCRCRYDPLLPQLNLLSHLFLSQGLCHKSMPSLACTHGSLYRHILNTCECPHTCQHHSISTSMLFILGLTTYTVILNSNLALVSNLCIIYSSSQAHKRLKIESTLRTLDTHLFKFS